MQHKVTSTFLQRPKVYQSTPVVAVPNTNRRVPSLFRKRYERCTVVLKVAPYMRGRFGRHWFNAENPLIQTEVATYKGMNDFTERLAPRRWDRPLRRL